MKEDPRKWKHTICQSFLLSFYYAISSPYRKHAVETTDTFDFLKEIVESVPDPSAGGTIDLDALSAENASKKKRAKGKKAAPGTDGESTMAPASKAAPKRRKKKVKSEEVAVDGNEDAVMAEPKVDEEEEERAPAMTDEDEDEDDQWKNDKPYIPGR